MGRIMTTLEYLSLNSWAFTNRCLQFITDYIHGRMLVQLHEGHLFTIFSTQRCGSVVKHVPSTYETLALFPIITCTQNKFSTGRKGLQTFSAPQTQSESNFSVKLQPINILGCNYPTPSQQCKSSHTPYIFENCLFQ